MFNADLETDLTLYSKTQDPHIFNQKLYEPLSNLFKWLWSRHSKRTLVCDFDDAQQKAMLNVIKCIKHYKQGKGKTAVSYARMLMQQELLRHTTKTGIHSGRTVGFEDDIVYDDKGRQIEFECKPRTERTMDEYAELLKDYLPQAPKEYRKVIRAIAKTLTTKAAYQMKYIDKVKHIAKTSKASIYLVKKVLKHIKQQRLYETKASTT